MRTPSANGLSRIAIAVALLVTWMNAVQAGQGPKIVFAKQEVELGRFTEGTPVEYLFRYRNEGDERLAIKTIKTSCAGCAAAAAGSGATQPGGEGVIRAAVRTTGRTGRQSFSVYVTTNDPASPGITLSLHFDLQPVIRCVPEAIDFGRLEPGSRTAEKTLRVEAMSQNPPSLTLGGYDQSRLRAELTSPTLSMEKTDADSGEKRDRLYVAHLSLRIADTAPPGQILETLKVIADLPGAPTANIPVVGLIPAPVELESSKVFFGILYDKRTVKKTVRLRATEPGFQILGFDSDIAGVSGETSNEQGEHRIHLSLDPAKAPPFIDGTVSIRTNSAFAPTLRIQVTGMIKEK